VGTRLVNRELVAPLAANRMNFGRPWLPAPAWLLNQDTLHAFLELAGHLHLQNSYVLLLPWFSPRSAPFDSRSVLVHFIQRICTWIESILISSWLLNPYHVGVPPNLTFYDAGTSPMVRAATRFINLFADATYGHATIAIAGMAAALA
jgi:hypothetical protein